jgi:hypothetical protein
MTQSWNDEVRTQLDNLASFPAKRDWQLGEWIDETRVRPGVATFAALPATDNELGDVRVVDFDQSWYYWNGLAWVPMGTGGGGPILTVTGIAPINVTAGPNPSVSHDASGAAAGTYGDANNSAQVTVDAKGHVTAVTTVPISTGPIGTLILSTGFIQIISSNTDQITPVAALHRIATNGVNHTLSSTPTINLPGAVVGQLLVIQNVDTARTVTIQAGVAAQLQLGSPSRQIAPGGSMILVYSVGSRWVELTHIQSTST